MLVSLVGSNFVLSFEVICKKENLKSSYMSAWDVGHLYSPVWPKNLLPMNSSYKEDVQKKRMLVIIEVYVNSLCFDIIMYLEFWYNVDKRFPPKLASWLSDKDRIPSCLSKTYKPNRDEMQRVFDKFDIDKDGKISASDLKQHFVSLMKKESMCHQVYKMVQAADFDGDKVINFTDFMELHEKGISELEIRKAFRMYDLDEDGKIGVDDLQKMFHRLGEKCSTLECERMIGKVDFDRDGKVDAEEFMIMMTKTLETLN